MEYTTGILGGSGLNQLDVLTDVHRQVGRTPYGDPSAPMTLGRMGDQGVVFLPRHGLKHVIPPHRVNYRANLWALKQLGVKQVIGVGAVGGILPDLKPRQIVIPDQIIDYTYGREHTYFDGESGEVFHIEFTKPYNESLRQTLLKAAKKAGVAVHDSGVYAATQGPRLETAAEIDRIERDGGTIVGMTGMPEAALAAELNLPYAALSLVVNEAAGRAPAISFTDIQKHLEAGMNDVIEVLQQLFARE